jgi:hypothetical protein
LELTKRAEALVAHFFSEDESDSVRIILQNECGNNLPYLKECSPKELERFRFAVIKIADGKVERLKSAVGLAKSDWRDLLMNADFANDIHVHERWADSILNN